MVVGNITHIRFISPYNFVIGNALMFWLEGNLAYVMFPSPWNVLVFVIEINL